MGLDEDTGLLGIQRMEFHPGEAAGTKLLGTRTTEYT